MPAYNYSSTAGSYTLTGDIAASATILVLNTVTGLPNSTPFKVVLEPGQPGEEIVKVTAVAGASLTIVRGWDGTSATAHTAGATVRHMVTAEDFTLSRAHEDSTAAHGATGFVVGTTNAQTLSNKDLSNGTNTFPAALVTLAGTQGLSNKSVLPPDAAGTALTFNTDPTRAADYARFVDPTFGVVAKISSGSFNAGPDGFRAYFNVNAGILKQQVNITASAVDVRGLVVKGANAQTANLQEWRKNDETVLASIDKDGNLKAANLADTGVVTTGITASSGWSIDSQALRKVGSLAQVYIRFSRTGATINSNSGGDLGNSTVGTVPAAYAPSIVSSGGSGPNGPAIGAVVSTDGTISLTAGPANFDITTGLTLSASFTYLV